MKESTDSQAIKKAVVRDIASSYKSLRELSRKIHDHPETALTEHRACAWLCGYLEKSGFVVEKGVCKLPTAFRARYGKGRPAIAFLAEYDALPKIGHACGHNLIATSAVAAGIACRGVVDRLGGSVLVYGTPGEEIAGGKAIMAERGAFRDADAALSTHPGGGSFVAMNALACQNLDVEFIGRAAHAAAEPEVGINALAAMILAFNAIDALRQHIREKERIHGVITDGGEVANVVPSHTAASFIVRAATDEHLDALKERVISCFAGAAAATGAEFKYKWDAVRYSAMKNNQILGGLFQKNMAALGRRIATGEGRKTSGSTDVGNVSQLIPTIHPTVSIAPKKYPPHSPEFERAAGTESALRRMLEAAGAMAMTAVDLLASPETMAGVRAEFEKG